MLNLNSFLRITQELFSLRKVSRVSERNSSPLLRCFVSTTERVCHTPKSPRDMRIMQFRSGCISSMLFRTSLPNFFFFFILFKNSDCDSVHILCFIFPVWTVFDSSDMRSSTVFVIMIRISVKYTRCSLNVCGGTTVKQFFS